MADLPAPSPHLVRADVHAPAAQASLAVEVDLVDLGGEGGVAGVDGGRGRTGVEVGAAGPDELRVGEGRVRVEQAGGAVGIKSLEGSAVPGKARGRGAAGGEKQVVVRRVRPRDAF